MRIRVATSWGKYLDILGIQKVYQPWSSMVEIMRDRFKIGLANANEIGARFPMEWALLRIARILMNGVSEIAPLGILRCDRMNRMGLNFCFQYLRREYEVFLKF